MSNNPLERDKPISISVSLVDDNKMQELNKKYLDRDYPTDVLSFNMEEETTSAEAEELPEHYLGDVIVNKDQAQRQSQEYGNTMEEEIAELVAHGILHLLGVHHEGDNH